VREREGEHHQIARREKEKEMEDERERERGVKRGKSGAERES
jgi:hypothetical protein